MIDAPQGALAGRLALRDWLYERGPTICGILALASMLAPLLVLLGLKNGVLDALRGRLLEDPAILVISPRSDAGAYDEKFLEKLRELPGARFVIGRTRQTATDVTLHNPQNGKSASIGLEPSAPGEPLLASLGLASPQNGEEPGIVLSQPAARALGARAGSHLVARLGRRSPGGRLENVSLKLVVENLLPEAAADRKMAFAPLGLLEDMENYRDYLAVPARKLDGHAAPASRPYASFRLYAEDLDAVAPLAARLLELNIESSTRAREIAGVKMLEHSINQVILIISCAVGAGFVAFSLSTVRSAVTRKRRMLGMLRLLGFTRPSLLSYPLIQAAATALAGFCLSCLVYLAVAQVIGHAFSQQALSCHLSPGELLGAALASCALALLAGLFPALTAACAEPSAAIREE